MDLEVKDFPLSMFGDKQLEFLMIEVMISLKQKMLCNSG